MLRDNIRGREGLLQGINPRNIGSHYHSYYDYKDFVLVAGSEIVASVTDSIIGQVLKIEPIYFLEAVKGKLFLTVGFTSGGVDSYTITLYTDDLVCTYTSVETVTTNLVDIDISDGLKILFKNTEDKRIFIKAKVSNAAKPVTIHGATVRIYTSAKDSFGSQQNRVTKYLGNTGIVNKDYLEDIQLEDEKLAYISEITDEFGSR